MVQTEVERKQKKILVVEDDQNLNKLVSYNLSKNGYAVESVFDGISAKDKLAGGRCF